MDTAPRYHINVFWFPDDGCWIADVPDLKSCSAHGDTPTEAVVEAEIAIELWTETARANNMVVPDAHYSLAICTAARVAS